MKFDLKNIIKSRFNLPISIAFGLLLFLSTSTVVGAEEEYTTVEELNDKVIGSGSYELTEDNKIDIKITLENIEDLNIEEAVLNDYKRSLEAQNKLIEDGYGEIDKNFDFKMSSNEDIKKISSQEFDEPLISLLANASLNVKSLVGVNRRATESYYWDLYYANLSSGAALNIALNGTAWWWKGKVQPRGPWDYKSRSGYSPYNTKWNATMYPNTRRVITSEYLGNYNYGFTGQFLFPEQILLWGGEYANGRIGVPENADDRAAIRKGFSDARTYW